MAILLQANPLCNDMELQEVLGALVACQCQVYFEFSKLRFGSYRADLGILCANLSCYNSSPMSNLALQLVPVLAFTTAQVLLEFNEHFLGLSDSFRNCLGIGD